MASQNEKNKRNFRNSKTWKTFRHEIISKQKTDYITGRKLLKGCECHHLDLNPDNYKNLEEENFVALNKQSHKFLHWLYGYYVNDRKIILRLTELLEKMTELNE